jgi:hypothetical protein
MMSKERELLQKWVNECQWRGSNMILLEETKELLAQVGQEPVAWMYDWEDTLNKESMRERITKIKTMIERPEAVNIRPLYTTPKREPFGPEE